MNDSLFDKYVYLVEKIVNKMNYGYVDKDDLFQAGLIGLYKAIEKYNEKKNENNNFISYCSVYIISEIKNELRNNKLIKLNKKIIKIKKYLKDNSNLSFNQISKNLNISIELIYLATIYKDDVVSLNQIINDEELVNNVIDYNVSFNNDYIDIINHLDEFSRLIITLKYYKNYSQEEIAKILNCSQAKISRIENKALEKMRKKLM
jgi:RNA polymerase sigma factor (sigma-70 family)